MKKPQPPQHLRIPITQPDILRTRHHPNGLPLEHALTRILNIHGMRPATKIEIHRISTSQPFEEKIQIRINYQQQIYTYEVNDQAHGFRTLNKFSTKVEKPLEVILWLRKIEQETDVP